MPEIRLLSSSIVNKIAAGEVIERPASVVKELLENAIDAGATRIDVSVEKGGAEGIRVADNGGGMAADQLPLAVASHATSKIQSADDLFDVRTLGFRGEALASIAEIAQLRIRSRPADQQAGAELEVYGGRVGQVVPCGAPVGTSVEVRQLFFNTPVRRRFLRSTQTEMGHVLEAFTRVALSHSAVHFTLEHNGRTLFELPPADRWRERITTFFGPEVGESLIPVGSEDGSLRLSGYVAEPSQSRSNNRLQYFFLNGRHIRDRSLQHALGEAYRGLLLTGRFPIAFLRLELPADQVDVNVHPTKLEVRFQDGGRVYSQLLGTLRQKFLSTDLTAHVRPLEPGDAEQAASRAHDREQAERHRDALVRWAQGELPGSLPERQDTEAPGEPPPALSWPEEQGTAQGLGELERPAIRPIDNPRFDRSGPVPTFRPFFENGSAPWQRQAPAETADRSEGSGQARRESITESPENAADQRQSPQQAAPQQAAPPVAAYPPGSRGIQVHNRYLVTENESGIVVIDQHALHERILYEQLRAKVDSGRLERQRLLVPEAVALTPPEAAAAMEAREALERLGIEIEPFGGDTVLVSSYPAMLANFDPSEVLRQVVDQLLSGGRHPEPRDLLDDMLHMIACKAAIKAGDRLDPAEVTSLLDQRHLYQDTHHCPHGRPTALVFTREELDRRFRRT